MQRLMPLFLLVLVNHSGQSTTPSIPPLPGWMTSSNPSSLSPSTSSDSCGTCAPGTVWLDIIFAVDSSQSMQQNGIDDVQSTIRTTLRGLHMARTEIRAGILVYSDTAEDIYKLDSINSDANATNIQIPYLAQYGTNMKSAIVKAMGQFKDFPNKAKARKVIVLFASAYREGGSEYPQSMATAFKNDGGIIITVHSGHGSGPIPVLDDIVSPGYQLKQTNLIVDDLQQAFCDANCFCPTNSRSYTTGFPFDCKGRCTPSGGCYKIVESAAAQYDAHGDCQDKGGHLVSIHDDDQQQFVCTLFPGRKQFWIGLNTRYNTWADGSPFDYAHWAPGQPDHNGECVYNYQFSGFNTGWYSQTCQMTLPYVCSIRPCSASNKDCKA